MSIQDEIKQRRTFAIISHPDAGKTTLTEKFLLYGGAVQMAGSVTSRKNQRASTSDWMELERKRGISISSTALQFDYRGFKVNLLDTPGHKDFSEDTYRVLTAVDSVVMVIDAAKGIESQTKKLFEVCRRREIPIFTFMNKLDRPTRNPLSLIDEVEDVLQIQVFPMNWPLGTGSDFKGVFDRRLKQVHLFESTGASGVYAAPVSIRDISDPVVRDRLPADAYEKLVEELELLDGAGAEFDPADILAGHTTPVFFGSALNNFGVQLLLDSFLDHSALPNPRKSNGAIVPCDAEHFSGFVFKILANMDPNHRDRIAFIRVCSGEFSREMSVHHSRTGKKVKLAYSHRLFGRERETVDKAYAGDIVGVVGQSEFGIGDTLTEKPEIVYDEIPRFTPECFAFIHNPNPSKFKRFKAGMDQLLQEGVVQELQTESGTQSVRLLAAVGPLQFEVVQYRLETEYGAEARLEMAAWKIMRWVSPAVPEEKVRSGLVISGCSMVRDMDGRIAILFPNEWALDYFREKNPDIELSDLPFKSLAIS